MFDFRSVNRMPWYHFIPWSKYILMGMMAGMTAWLFYNIQSTAGTEGTLGEYKVLSWATCLLLLIGFCLSNVTLGKFRKTPRDDSGEAGDADSESEEEEPSQVLPVRVGGCIRKLAIYHNFIAFGYFHAAYCVAASLGAVLVLEAGIFSAAMLWQWHVGGEYSSDLAHGALFLFVPGACMVLAVVLVANVGGLYKADEACLKYVPFENTVSVPGAVFARAFLKSFTANPYTNTVKLSLGMYFVLFTPYALRIFHEAHPKEGGSWKEELKSQDIKYFLQLIWISFGSSGFLSICWILRRFYNTAKLSLLNIMEVNWRQNLFACEHIVEQSPILNLGILVSLLGEKKGLPSNTDVVKQAFHYVELPLWKAKPPFLPLQQQQQLQ